MHYSHNKEIRIDNSHAIALYIDLSPITLSPLNLYIYSLNEVFLFLRLQGMYLYTLLEKPKSF